MSQLKKKLNEFQFKIDGYDPETGTFRGNDSYQTNQASDTADKLNIEAQANAISDMLKADGVGSINEQPSVKDRINNQIIENWNKPSWLGGPTQSEKERLTKVSDSQKEINKLIQMNTPMEELGGATLADLTRESAMKKGRYRTDEQLRLLGSDMGTMQTNILDRIIASNDRNQNMNLVKTILIGSQLR